MGLKTANPGHFTYPAGPAAGLAVTSATGANTLTATYVAFVTSTSAIFITGLGVEALTSTASPSSCFVQLGSGTTGAEVIIDQEIIPLSVPGTAVTASRIAGYVPIMPPVPVATSTRMVAKTADSIGSIPWTVWLSVITQTNVVDDGVAMSANVTQFRGTASAGTAGYAGLDWANINAPTTVQGLTGTTISAAQTVATVTGNVNGSVGSVTGAVGSVTGAVGSVTGNVGGNVVGSVGSVAVVVSANVTQFAGTTSKGAAGYAGIDWAQINAPTTVQGLTGTTISAAQAIASVTGAVGSVTGNVGGNVTGSVGSVVAIVSANVTRFAGTTSVGTAGYVGVDWSAINAPTSTQALTGTTISAAQTVATVTGNVTGSVGSVTGAVGSVTGNVGGNVVGSVGSVTGAVGSVTAAVTVGTNNDKTGYSITSNVKKNTAAAAFMFVMTDSTNHAPLTGLTVTATRSLDGAAFVACANAVAEISGGWYQINLAATDTNANRIALLFSATGADNTNIEINTQP